VSFADYRLRADVSMSLSDRYRIPGAADARYQLDTSASPDRLSPKCWAPREVREQLLARLVFVLVLAPFGRPVRPYAAGFSRCCKSIWLTRNESFPIAGRKLCEFFRRVAALTEVAAGPTAQQDGEWPRGPCQ
jgi:hypothetical protein